MHHKPNFFILGAAKCGTTSLYAYLKQHPQIFMSPVKEPSFFCESFQVVNNAIDYFKLFDGVREETVIGEASHVYFSNPATAGVLKTLFPQACFVVILRNPADRAYSLYHHMRRYGFEYAASFERALEMEEARVASDRFKDNCPQYIYNYFYFRSGRFGEQVQRYLELFDRQQFHFLTLDQLKADPEASIRGICDQLELDSTVAINTRVHNAGNLTRRYGKPQYIWRTRLFPMLRKRKRFKTCEWIIRLLDRINVMPVPPMNPTTRSALTERYATDLEKLESLTGIAFPADS
jgi:hypothetical protein